MAGIVVVAGSLAQKFGQGGHAWVLLQYLLGFKRLGWDVLFLDRLEPEMCVDAAGQVCPPEKSLNWHYLRRVMEGFDLADAFALLGNRGEGCAGLSRRRVLEVVKRAAFLLNVMGFLTDEEILSRAARRVFLDIDPGFGQIWHATGLHPLVRGHDDYVTIAENMGRPGCTIPTCGVRWITTPQPVVLDSWRPAAGSSGEWITSVASWRGAYGPLKYGGKTLGLRVHEFRKFVSLPALSTGRFQLALDIHPGEAKDLALLSAHGWSLVDPRQVAGDPWAYQTYIQSSRAEFMVAKNMYVETRSGWFSDRSICYLASGKPVVVQDTGLEHLPGRGEGVLTFSTLEEARDAVEAVVRDDGRHARAARAVAEEYFDSDKVLGRLLSQLGMD